MAEMEYLSVPDLMTVSQQQTQNRFKRGNSAQNTPSQSNQNTVTSISGITKNPEQFHQLRVAIEGHDIDSFNRVFNQFCFGVNDLDEIGGPSLLMIAAESGCLRILKELISRGADIDYQDYDNWTALMCATKESKVDCALELIESGANIELKDMGGWNALMWASYKGVPDVAEVLLKKKSSPNFFDNDNHMTCLCWASGRGFSEVTALLLKHGAKVDIGDKYGTTPLIWAARKGFLDIVKMLVKSGAHVDSVGMFGWSPLIVATRGNFTQVVEVLLSYKPNVNICDPQGLTPLMTAAKEGNLDIVRLLLASHAYVNMSDKNGYSALIHASKTGHVAVVEALVKAHADPDHYGQDRKTALHWAVEKGHVEAVRCLLKSDPNMEIATREAGDTAIMKTIRSRKIQLVKLLLDKKAKVSVVERDGDTVLHIEILLDSRNSLSKNNTETHLSKVKLEIDEPNEKTPLVCSPSKHSVVSSASNSSPKKKMLEKQQSDPGLIDPKDETVL